MPTKYLCGTLPLMECDSNFQTVLFNGFFSFAFCLVASDTLKLSALFISPNLCKLTLEINVTEVKIISSDFSVLNFLSKICNVFII